jgi:hypothetical protein
MTRTGKSGGLISLSSFVVINDDESEWINQRFASSVLKEAAMKEGVQSLYANPEETIKRYKDFDIAKAMSDHKGKFLWVRARAIDADTINANGDYFSKEELLKETEIKGEKRPAYKTFEGVPVYTNHKNDDIENAKGQVVYSEWDEDENCVWVTFYIDEDAYPHIARGIRQGYMVDVSMGCQVESGICSVCKHEATTEKDYCQHMQKYKGKACPDINGKKAYELNLGLKFIELSVVGDGAFENCSVDEIYDVDEILSTALQLQKRVSAIHGDILVASASLPAESEERHVYEDCLRQVAATSRNIVRVAQTAGTLVGGQILAQEGSGQNTTVQSILQYLGIDAASGLNTLDMLNLALNFLEVTVMNLFARKDNIDLAHVAKITKSMGDLQATMQDMIDDGVESGPGVPGGQAKAPLNQAALQQQGTQQPQAPAQGQVQPDYSNAGAVGRSIGPTPTQPQAFVPAEGAIGGGVLASTNTRKNLILWDSPDEEKREVFASVNKSGDPKQQGDKLIKLGENLVALAQSIGISPVKQHENDVDCNIQSTSNNEKSGGINMDIWEKFKANRLVKDAALVSMDFNVDDSTKQYRITLSTDGSIKAYHNGTRMSWEPDLTDQQLEAIANNKGADVAADLLRQFKKAKSEGRTVEAWKEPSGVFDEVREKQQTEVWPDTGGEGTDKKVKELLLDGDADEYGRKGEDNRTREETLEAVRTGTPEIGKVREQTLDDDAGLYGWNFVDDDVREALLKDARKGNPQEVIELQLKGKRAHNEDVDPAIVVNSAINAIADAVVVAHAAPSEVIKIASRIADRKDLDELLVLASLGSKSRIAYASKYPDVNISAEAALYNALGERVTDRVSAAELADTLTILAKSGADKIKDAVVKLAHSKKDNITATRTDKTRSASKEDQIKAIISAQSNHNDSFTKEDLKAAISAIASSSIETGLEPKEVIASVADIVEDSLILEVEMARTASAVEVRQTERERNEFWGRTKTASKSDVDDNVIGWLADYTDAYGLSDSVSVVKAAKKLTESPDVAVKLAKNMIEYRTAGVEVTDEDVKTKRIVCRVEDLGGIDVKSEDFQNQFRDKAIEIFGQVGFTVDPATFSFSDVNVSADGGVTASVTSRWSRTTNVDAMASAPVEGEVVDTIMPENQGETEIAGITPQVYEEGDTVMTAAAKTYRRAKREEILARYAQMPMPGGGGLGAMPMAGGAGGGMPPLDPALGANADQGVSALTGGTPPEDGENPDVDEQPAPGQKKPWGSICPQCGSTDVDVANGEGNCQSCGAQLEYSFSVQVKPGNDSETGMEADETAPEGEAPFGPDTGLGAATAPATTLPGGAGAGAGAPPPGAPAPLMAQVSWLSDSDVFVRLASPNYDREIEKVLPVGFICPACGSRDVVKHKNLTYCHTCPTISKSVISEYKGDPTKVRVSIKWLG